MAREREDGHIYFVGGLVAFPGESTILQSFAQLVMDGTEAENTVFLGSATIVAAEFPVTPGLTCVLGFYLLSEKIGKSMFEVHKPVPQFTEKLLVSVERYMPPTYLHHFSLTLN